jgi:diguanylate cyclase (GGDEF)-like protein/excisionase family DNA binding protein
VWLRVGDVASALGVSANTVRRWTDVGRLAAYRSPGGHRRYLAEDVMALLPQDEGEGAAQPGDFAALRRETQDLRAVVQAGLSLMSLMVEDPQAVAGETVRALCALTGAPHGDVYLVDGDRLRLVVSANDGDLDPGRQGAVWATDEWIPVAGDPVSAGVTCIEASDGRLEQRARLALQRRGCRSLAWAPMVLNGELVGAIELSDAGDRDFSRHAEALHGLAGICAEAVAVQRTYGELAHRDKTVRELVDLSREVAQTHDFERFVLRFAERILTAENADCVDVYRAGGDVIRSVISCTREGADPSLRDTVLDTSRYPSLEPTLRDHTPVALNDLNDERLGDGEAELMRGWGYASSLTMPLVAGGRLVGLLILYDDAERDWNAELEFLTSVCQLVAGVFDSNALLEETEDRSRYRGELIELGADLAAAEAPMDIAECAAARLHSAVQCTDCDIWWLEEGYLRCLASVDDGGVDESVRGRLLQLDHYPSTRRALEEREILVISSLDDERLTDEEREDFGEFDFHSLVSIPLVSNDAVVGLIDVFDVRERDYDDVRSFLASAGRTVADALRNAELLAELRRGNAAQRELVELGDRLNEADTLEGFSRAVAERLRTILSAEDCDIWQVDGGVLRCLASVDSRGWDEEEAGSERDLAEYEATVKALAANEPIVVGDLESSELGEKEAEAYRRWGFRSMVSLPLVVDGRAIGLIDVFDTRVRDYGAHLDFIRSVGRLLAGSFEKALLVERLEGGNRDLRLLVDSGMEFGATLDVDAVLRTVAERILAVSEADVCDVFRLEGHELHTLFSVGTGWPDDPPGTRYRLDDYSTFLEGIETRRPVARLDVLNDPHTTEAEIQDAERWGYRSSLDVPLISHGEVIGFISLANFDRRAFARQEMVIGLAQVASQAISNAALFARARQTARETQLLNDIASRTAASLDLEEVVTAAVDELGQLMTFADHSVLLLEGDSIGTVISSRPRADALLNVRLDDFGAGFVERLAADAVTVLRLPDDVPALAGSPAIEGLRSAIVVALPSDAGLLGVLNLSSADADAFADADRHLLERVGTQLSLAIKNAQLYEEIKRMHLGNLKALSSALNAKDYYTFGHAARVATYTVMLGRELGWPEDMLTSLEEAAYLHDIGKISISDRVLLKPGRLNPQEWEQMREHPVVSADIIRPLFPADLVLAVRYHHERYDGTGYPDGIAGEQIPVLARAMAVVDAYDAMSCRRPYKVALSYSECLAELQKCRGTQFDPGMVDAFLRVLEDVARRRAEAEEIAAEAASRISGETHLLLRSREDEDSEEYRQIEAVLREVRDANPPTRFLTTHALIDKHYVIGVDPEENDAEKSHLGDEIFADDVVAKVLEGSRPEANTVFADEFGVWVTGLAPIRAADGRVAAVVEADLSALSLSESETLRGDGRRTFAGMLQTAAVRLSRAEIDSITDALTGLYNHRYLHERLNEELHRAREHGTPLSTLFLDLDHFKDYNDANGHSAGDAVLREVAHLIEQSVRNVDVAARYGGEEFVVLLVETGRETALKVAERIRERLRAAGYSANGVPLTVSIGVAGYPDDADQREDLLEKADAAMYLAKRRGRDQVASAGGD